MPNHIHGIIQIVKKNDDDASAVRRGAPWRVSTDGGNRFGPLKSKSLSSIINHYKGAIKRFCNKNNCEYFNWQARFFDHIVRNEADLIRIRKYIQDNIKNWKKDRNFVNNLK